MNIIRITFMRVKNLRYGLEKTSCLVSVWVIKLIIEHSDHVWLAFRSFRANPSPEEVNDDDLTPPSRCKIVLESTFVPKEKRLLV